MGGDINTGTSFTIGNLTTSGANTGDLAGLPALETFGPVSFDTGSGTSFHFSDTAKSDLFGAFASTSIKEVSNDPGFVSFYILGNWTPGTFGGVPSGSYASSFSLSFTQNGGTGTAISDSGTFSVPPSGSTPIPELSTWAMMGLGFAGLGFAGFRSPRKSVAFAA